MLPNGFRGAAVACGIKRDPDKLDLSVIVSDRPAAAAGVFTQNRVAAPPVQVTRTQVPAASARAIVANSGNANSCTGKQGLDDARRMTELVSQHLNCAASKVLVCSTGIIGERLPMPKVEAGIHQALAELAVHESSLELIARGIMTTDTVPKFTQRTLDLGGIPVQLAGVAKGAAMIGPNMATMLCFMLTDASVIPEALQQMLRHAVNRSFNLISVEGHTSTSDTVLVLANGAAGGSPLAGAAAERFEEELVGACMELAQAIVRDAEGARHFVTIDVEGLRSEEEARRVAKAVADSPLVKTAIYGADPNWGRIVSAAGYAGVEFAEADLRLWLGDILLYDRGRAVASDLLKASEQLRSLREVGLRLQFALGTAGCRFWTCDLTEEYVRLNAEYHT